MSKTNKELTTEELLHRLLDYHTNVVLDSYNTDTDFYTKENDQKYYDECLKEMIERIKKDF